jgi:hypothetical protein
MSESLFFLFSTTLLIGLEKERNILVVIGLIGAGLCRSVTSVFVPVFITIYLYRKVIKKEKTVQRKYLVFSLLSILILLSVFSIQWYQTGEFFAFAKTQRFWGAHWQLPDIPFNSWQPEENIYVDQLAVFISLVCLISMMFVCFTKKIISDASMFSILYFSYAMLLMLFTHGGGFVGMNRYVLATPYFYLFIKEISLFSFKRNHRIYIAVLGILYYIICWHMATSALRIMVFSSVLLGIFIVVFLLKSKTQWASFLFSIFVIVALLVQGIFWYRYVSNVWVG